jgi:putative transcriptional regulator
MDIEKIAQAIEQDAGQPIEGLRESLQQMQEGRAGRTYSPDQLLIRQTRNQLGLSQQRFAELINTPVATVRDWEQGRTRPPGVAIMLCRILSRHPEHAQELTTSQTALSSTSVT